MFPLTTKEFSVTSPFISEVRLGVLLTHDGNIALNTSRSTETFLNLKTLWDSRSNV